MKLNIKNARRLESQIDAEIDRLKDKVSERKTYPTYDKALKETTKRIESNMVKISKLHSFKMHIRKLVGEFNATSGINDATHEIAFKEFQCGLVESISFFSEPSQRGGGYGSNAVEYVSGVDEDFSEKYHVDALKLRREIVRLKDKCQGINSTGTVELDQSMVEDLKEFGLID